MNADATSSRQNDVVISVSRLGKRFGQLLAVDGLSFDVRRGEIFGFLGPNGAGKTTTIQMICGLSEPSAGEILILGQHIGEGADTKTHIGLCPQENVFWPKLTCLEQLAFMGEMYGMPGKAAKARSEELLEWMALQEKANVLAEKLSGGMKRRLTICLALVHDPDILILDEPEVGLDPQSRVLVRGLVRGLTFDKTVILTTHNMDEADRLSDRVAIIDRGRLLMLDTPDKLKKSVGEGDILEIELEDTGFSELNGAAKRLSTICDQVDVFGTTLTIKAKNLLEIVSDITHLLNEMGVGIKTITMRENTLEDVFLHLTGRKLRQ
jgi:ABC-2 type transport system ATP-binding protein